MLNWISDILNRRLDQKKREVIKLRWEVEKQKKLLEDLKRQQKYNIHKDV